MLEQEPKLESTLRSVQEPVKIFKGPIFCTDACCWQTEWNCDMFFDLCCHVSQSVTLGGSTEHFTTNDCFKVMAYQKYSK